MRAVVTDVHRSRSPCQDEVELAGIVIIPMSAGTSSVDCRVGVVSGDIDVGSFARVASKNDVTCDRAGAEEAAATTMTMISA